MPAAWDIFLVLRQSSGATDRGAVRCKSVGDGAASENANAAAYDNRSQRNRNGNAQHAYGRNKKLPRQIPVKILQMPPPNGCHNCPKQPERVR